MPQDSALQLTPPPAQRWQPRSFQWWYHSIIDLMLAHPEWTKKEIASHLGVASATVILITNSDLFRAHFEQRRAEYSAAHDEAVVGRMKSVAMTTLEKISEAVEKRPNIPLKDLTDLADKVLGRLGYGGSGAPVLNLALTQNNQSVSVSATAEDLRDARAALRRSETLHALGAPKEPELVVDHSATYPILDGRQQVEEAAVAPRRGAAETPDLEDL